MAKIFTLEKFGSSVYSFSRAVHSQKGAVRGIAAGSGLAMPPLLAGNTATTSQNDTMKKTILVTGATGQQGGSVLRHLIADGGFAVRALTRNVHSEKARALASLGCEVVAGDLSNNESIGAALNGAWGVFGVTNFWEHFEREREHGRNLIEAVAETPGVQHFVLSTLHAVFRISGGKYAAPHLDIKAELEAYCRERVPASTYVQPAFYYENFHSFFPPQLAADGAYHFGFPQGDAKLAGVSVEDFGGVVTAIFRNPEAFRGKTVGIVGDELGGADYAAQMADCSGKNVVYTHIPKEQFEQLPFPGAGDLANMFAFNAEFLADRSAELSASRQLYPGIRSFGQWLRDTRFSLG